MFALLHSCSYTITYYLYLYYHNIIMYYKKVLYLNRINYITFLVYNGCVGHFFREDIIKI